VGTSEISKFGQESEINVLMNRECDDIFIFWRIIIY